MGLLSWANSLGHKAADKLSGEMHHAEQVVSEEAHVLKSKAVAGAHKTAGAISGEIHHAEHVITDEVHAVKGKLNHAEQVVSEEAQVLKNNIVAGAHKTAGLAKMEAISAGQKIMDAATSDYNPLKSTGERLAVVAQQNATVFAHADIGVTKEPSLQAALQTALGRQTTITPAKVLTASKLSEKIYDTKCGPNGELLSDPMVDELKKQGNTVIPVESRRYPGRVDELIIVDSKGNGRLVFAGTKSGHDGVVDVSGWNESSKSKDSLVSMINNNLNPYAVSTPNAPLVHKGIKDEFNQRWADIEGRIPANIKSLEIDGHSLGGALANHAVLAYAAKHPSVPIEVITFGAPRTGDTDFCNQVTKATGGNYARIAMANDPVPESGMGAQPGYHPIFFDANTVAVGKNTDTSRIAALSHLAASATHVALSMNVDTSHSSANYRGTIETQIRIDNARMEMAFNKISDQVKDSLAGIFQSGGAAPAAQKQNGIIDVRSKDGATVVRT